MSERAHRGWLNADTAIAATALTGIAASLGATAVGSPHSAVPLIVVLAAGGAPLVFGLVRRALRAEFGSDQLAGIAIVTAIALHEYLAGSIVILMLAGGNALEQFAVFEATSVLRALAKRLPAAGHRVRGVTVEDIPVQDIQIGDELVVLPHEACPTDGEVVSGRGSMDESYLTGEPFLLPKGPGAAVLSGALNGDTRLTIRATRRASDSRYAQIMTVMSEAGQHRPRMRRVGDQLGAWYTPFALAIAIAAWAATGSAERFLSVLVIATPCPLLIGIPVAIIGAISTAARRGIIIRDPAALEQIRLCRTMILDKTGTLTYGLPVVTAERYEPPFTRDVILPAVAAMEQFSRHPLAAAIVTAARESHFVLPEVERIRDEPGVGLHGRANGLDLLVTNREHAGRTAPLPHGSPTGLECVVLANGALAAVFEFHDAPRDDSRPFVSHLGPRHGFTRVLLVSGDREAEARRLASLVSISDVYAGATPEQKLEIVRREAAQARTVVVGDGINDAPALMTATVGVAFGHRSDVTTQAAHVVIVDSSLSKLDELLHIGARLRRIALQSALGGMALSICGMALAAAGWLTPVAGAIAQEGIDLASVLNALRTTRAPAEITDFAGAGQVTEERR